MKAILKIEQLFLLLLTAFLFTQLDYVWWWFLLLFLTPDISMAGYIFGPKIGAVAYIDEGCDCNMGVRGVGRLAQASLAA